jgi:hypothetical protein
VIKFSAAVAIAIAVIGVLTWRSVDSSAPVQATGTRTASAADTYSIFAASTTRVDASGWRLPPDNARVGARLDEARLVLRDATQTVAAVPAAKAPCLFTRFADGSQGIACGGASGEPPTNVGYSGALGLVPDAVDAVTLTMTDGTTRVAPVKNNVWTAPDDAATAAYSLTGRVIKIDLMPRSSMPPGDTTDPTQAPSRGPDGAS